MLPLRDALRLASVKVGVRKGRAIMTILSLSLGIVTMLVSAFAADGVVRVGRELFRDSRGGRAFVLEMSLGTSENDTKSLTQAVEEKKDKGAIGGFEMRSFKDDGFLVEEMRPTNDAFASSGSVLKTIDPLFVQDYLDPDKNFDDVYDGKIPVIVSKDLAMSVVYGDQQFDFGKKEAYDKWQEARKQFSGKTVHLVRTTQLPAVLTTPDGKSFTVAPDGSQKILEPNEQGTIPAPEFTSEQLTAARLPQEFVVVGFARSSFIDFSSEFISGQSFLIPPWALEKHPELAKSFVPSSYMIEFKDKAARDVFADDAARTPGDAFNILPILGQYEAFEEFTKFAQRAGLVIGGVLLLLSAISVWTTLAKIVSDSRREIGVFRAVGARKLDILLIFFAYAFLLSTGGFLVGAILALAFSFGASVAWGDTVFYFMAGLSNATVTETPAYIFLSVPWMLAGLAYVVVVLVGFLGALVPGIRASRLDPVAALRD